MPPDLPESYYLDNVLTLFDAVSSLYGDLLDEDEKKFLKHFYQLGEDARKLCIRLLNRNGDCFRRDRLKYGEIGSIDQAAIELQRAGLLEINPRLEDQILLSLFTKVEILTRLDLPADCKHMKREALDLHLCEQANSSWQASLINDETIYRIRHNQDYQRLQLLFFGNMNQSMTDFVLRDLGLMQYEQYQVDRSHRPYQNRLDIEQHWLLYELQDLLPGIEADDTEQLLACFNAIPKNIRLDSPAWSKAERLKNTIARQLERCTEIDTALSCFEQCAQPPARERRIRMLAQRGDAEAALSLCQEISSAPLDEEELQFACSFAPRLARKHKLLLPAELAPAGGKQELESIQVTLPWQASVELAAAEHLSNDGVAVYVENNLFNGVLGLLLWEVIFADIPGAFFNPFQYRPADFYQPNFFSRRKVLLSELWLSIHSNDDIWRQVKTNWQKKYGISNPLVNWPALSIELIELSLQLIDHAHWMAIFKRIMRDLRNNRSGFPDLVHFPKSGGYVLVEVKGPGDKLQKNQQRWMQYFAEHGIPHRLMQVEWQAE